ncbi:MAG: putative Ig domain-containing protein [Acidobacteria bacterium]|nr:putative Ig domain-containing protein [Acidobacteriota bacterium]
MNRFRSVLFAALLGLVLTGLAAAQASINPSTLPHGSQADYYNQQLTFSTGLPTFWWVSAGSLPTGMSLDSGGAISGYPSQIGPSTFTISAYDSNLTMASRQYTLVIDKNLTITTPAQLPNALINLAYNTPLTATVNGSQTPYFNWYQSSGTMPPGMSVDSGGAVIGTPTQTGTYTFGVTVQSVVNDIGLSDTVVFSLVVVPPVSITTTSVPNATQAIPYSQPLAAINGIGAYTWGLSTGVLPPGVTLSSGGVLSGIPTTLGTYNFTVGVNAGGTSGATQALSIIVQKNLQITSTSPLPNGLRNTAYSTQLAATGGTTQTWSLGSGSLPAGVSLSSGGLVAGSPSVAGVYNFVANVASIQNSIALSDQRAFALTVNTAPLVISPNLAAGQQAIPYSQPLSGSGGSGNFSWSITSGSLPPGLSLAAGVISGIPTQLGTFSFTVTLSDPQVVGVPSQVSQILSITIGKNLRIVTGALPNGIVHSAYSSALSAAGGIAPYTWYLAEGSLPAGLSLSSSGAITGTPSTFGASTFVATVYSTQNDVQMTDSRTFTVEVTVPTLSITTTTLPNGVPGVSYAGVLAATGGTAPLNWVLQAGQLPTGLTLNANGHITGIPTTEGTFTFTAQVLDDGFQTASRGFSIIVAYPALTVTAVLPAGTVGVRYSGTVQATGGTGRYTFTVASGNLPGGLSLAPSGDVSGTPTAAGSFPFVAQATDSSGKSATADFTLVIKPAPITISPSSLPPGVVGSAYSAALTASGGTEPYVFAGSGLPPGLSLSSSGQVSGTPTAKGDFAIAVTVTDKNGLSASASIPITINLPVLTITGPAPDGALGVAVTGALTVSGGTPPYTCAVTGGGLPAGVTLNSSCAFGGTPTALGSSQFTVQATDKNGVTASQSFTMVVKAAPLVITTSSLAAGTVGSAYSQTVSATGGTGALTWSASGLPAGVAMSAAGVLSGVSLSAGTFQAAISVTDSVGVSAAKTLGLTFNLPPAPTGSFGGLGSTAPPATQPTFQLSFAASYPVAITGSLTLTFKGDDGSDDPAVQFSTGGRTLAFTLPANSTTPVFSVPNAALATGTTAGLITITAGFQAAGQDITPNPAPTQQIRVNAGAPTISTVTATRSSGTITVVVTGFVTSKQVTSAAFTFNPASGANFQSTTLTVQLGSTFSAYYSGTASQGFGSQFKLTQTFTVSGDTAAIGSVSVVLSNSQGGSAAATATIQ